MVLTLLSLDQMPQYCKLFNISGWYFEILFCNVPVFPYMTVNQALYLYLYKLAVFLKQKETPELTKEHQPPNFSCFSLHSINALVMTPHFHISLFFWPKP